MPTTTATSSTLSVVLVVQSGWDFLTAAVSMWMMIRVPIRNRQGLIISDGAVSENDEVRSAKGSNDRLA